MRERKSQRGQRIKGDARESQRHESHDRQGTKIAMSHQNIRYRNLLSVEMYIWYNL